MTLTVCNPSPIKAVTVLAVTLLLAACAGGRTTTTESGSGPVVMSPAAYAAYEAYTAKADPLIFALSGDGKHAYFYYCQSVKKDCDEEKYTQLAVDRCTGHGGDRCYIFARRKAVVWRDAGNWKPATAG